MNNRCELVILPKMEDVFFRPYIQIHFSERYIEYQSGEMRIPYRTASDPRLINCDWYNSGPLFTKRTLSYRKISNLWDSDSDFSNRSEIWQAPRRQRYHYNIQSRGFEASWWRHQMETFSALLALCAENSPVTGEFPSQRPVTRSFDVFFDLRLNKRLSKPSRHQWFETPLHPLWRHCNDRPMYEESHVKDKHGRETVLSSTWGFLYW